MLESVSSVPLNGLRTYRPKLDRYTFSNPDIKARVEKWLEGVRNKTASRALLIVGPYGLGKTTLGRALCSELKVHDSDIQEVNCGSTRTLEDARELLDRIRFSPSRGEYRTLILDEVHQMVTNAQQAFLTPIEQLPDQTLLIACTSAPESLNQAFRSRFFEIRLQPYSEEQLTEILENLPTPPKPKQIATIVQLASGNPRLAIGLAEGGVGPGDKALQEMVKTIDLFVPLLLERDKPTLLLMVSQLGYQDRQPFFAKVLTLLEGLWYTQMGKTNFAFMQDQKTITGLIAKHGETLSADLIGRYYKDLVELQYKSPEALKAWVMNV